MNEAGAACNLKCEEILRTILSKLERQFRKHYVLLQSTVKYQKNILDSLWVLCQRYLILTRGAICVQPYPRELTIREEREIRQKFRTTLVDLQQSNSKLSVSMYSLKAKCLAFDVAFAKVDTNFPNPIIEGTRGRKPIFYYIEMFSDLYRAFHAAHKQLDLLGKFLMVDNMASILEYQKILDENVGVSKYYEECLPINNKSWF